LRQDISEQINKKCASMFSESLRRQLANITDYKADFDKIYEGFIENSLPKDDLYKQIENSLDPRKDRAKAEAKLLLDPENAILPEPDSNPVES